MRGERGGRDRNRPQDEIEALERRLHVRRRARRDGQLDQPTSDSQSPSETECDIAAAINAELEQVQASEEQVLQALERDLRRSAPVGVNLGAVFLEAEAELRQVESQLGRPFRALREVNARTQSQLAAFRETHGLHRPAAYPVSAVFQAALLAMAAAFEAMFSATLFANASEAGLLGGAAVALGLSGANVALGFLGGFLGLRYLQHRRPPWKLTGAACLAAAVAAALGLNAFAALWRERAEALRPIELAERAELLGLTQPEAVILLMLGLAVWVFSALKGYSGFDDPYPDFGKFDRAARRAAEALEEGREDLREALQEPMTKARERAEGEVARQRDAVRGMRAAYEQAADRLLDLSARARRLAESGEALLRLYRHENQAARRTPPPPAFASPHCFAALREDPLARAADLLRDAERVLEAAQDAAAAGLHRLVETLHGVAERLEGEA